jgi:hypothetical protein
MRRWLNSHPTSCGFSAVGGCSSVLPRQRTCPQPYNVITNIGGHVGWHNSPLPGPFFPNAN